MKIDFTSGTIKGDTRAISLKYLKEKDTVNLESYTWQKSFKKEGQMKTFLDRESKNNS